MASLTWGGPSEEEEEEGKAEEEEEWLTQGEDAELSVSALPLSPRWGALEEEQEEEDGEQDKEMALRQDESVTERMDRHLRMREELRGMWEQARHCPEELAQLEERVMDAFQLRELAARYTNKDLRSEEHQHEDQAEENEAEEEEDRIRRVAGGGWEGICLEQISGSDAVEIKVDQYDPRIRQNVERDLIEAASLDHPPQFLSVKMVKAKWATIDAAERLRMLQAKDLSEVQRLLTELDQILNKTGYGGRTGRLVRQALVSAGSRTAKKAAGRHLTKVSKISERKEKENKKEGEEVELEEQAESEDEDLEVMEERMLVKDVRARLRRLQVHRMLKHADVC
jgi:hypothetical protein